MGLLNKKNIAMAKKFADKNKDKIASGVKKATDTIDEKTGGKHTDRLKKIDDAARKYAGVDPVAPVVTTTADQRLQPDEQLHGDRPPQAQRSTTTDADHTDATTTDTV